MKNISIKILSIVMTLAVLVGLIASAVPVSAADLAWTKLTGPSVTVGTDANVFAFSPDGKTVYLYDGANLRKSVNGGVTWTTTGIGTTLNGKTVTKIVVNPDNALSLVATDGTDVYRSTNGGTSWYAFNPFDAGEGPTADAVIITDIDIANGTSGDAILVGYADAAAGATANKGGVAYFDTANGIWLNTWDGTLGTTAIWETRYSDGTTHNFNALAVAFSADFANDYGIMAIAGDTTDVEVRSIFVADTTEGNWNADIATASITLANTSASKADFAFASDFAMGSTTYGKAFFFVDANTYRFNPKTQSGATKSTTVDLGCDITPFSIDFTGPIATGTLAVGGISDAFVDTISNVATATSSASLSWTPSTKNPRGGETPNTLVRFLPTTTTLYAGTAGDAVATTATATAVLTGGVITSVTITDAGAGYFTAPTVTVSGGTPETAAVLTATITAKGAIDEIAIDNGGVGFDAVPDITIAAPAGFSAGSALSTSTDYDAFQAISMISVSALSQVKMPNGGLTGAGSATQFQKIYDNYADVYSLFESTDSGATWKLIYENGANPFTVYLSPSFATDNTIYLTQTTPALAAMNKIIKSTDGGKTWGSNTIVGSLKATAFAPIDGSNYWVGTTAGIRSTSTSTVYLDGWVPMAIINLPGCMLVWEFDAVPPSNSEWWYSTDNGVTFNNTGAADAVGFTGAFTFGFDGTNWTIYLAANNNIYSYTVGVSSVWSVYKSSSIFTNNIVNAGGSVSSISAAPGGVWYFTTSPTDDADAQVWRSTNFTADSPTVEPVAGTSRTALGGAINSVPALSAVANAAGNNVLYTNVAGTATATAYGPVWKSFTDSVLVAPKITAPAANASVAAITDITWDAVAKATAYDVQVAYDSAFSNLAAYTDPDHPLTSTLWTQVKLLAGKTYYVRVRVAEGHPMASSWSAPVTFTTMLPSSGSLTIDATGRIYPTNGATDVSLNPAFTWGSVGGAATYEFKLSTKADFSDTIDSATGLTTTVYAAAVALKPGVTYFWEVRAVNGAISGEWVTNAFTTSSGVGPTGTAAQPPITVTIPTPTFNIPQQTVSVSIPPATVTNVTTTTTPAWVWVIIAIGAVLVIAVIVLIARTRRV